MKNTQSRVFKSSILAWFQIEMFLFEHFLFSFNIFISINLICFIKNVRHLTWYLSGVYYETKLFLSGYFLWSKVGFYPTFKSVFPGLLFKDTPKIWSACQMIQDVCLVGVWKKRAELLSYWCPKKGLSGFFVAWSEFKNA